MSQVYGTIQDLLRLRKQIEALDQLRSRSYDVSGLAIEQLKDKMNELYIELRRAENELSNLGLNLYNTRS